ncbi:MAG TPA: ACT domain-containing protein, partial [Candidatus Edwardsbacteria bacterium]|nr:ACT domain-containing protein [Candidatus Edwardsbacteria bacterium]
DVVEIITSNTARPSQGWLAFVRSRHARNKIRLWFKKEQRAEHLARGRELVEREFQRLRLEQLLGEEELQRALAEAFDHRGWDDLLAALGYGEHNVEQLVLRLRQIAPQHFQDEQLVFLPPRPDAASGAAQGVAVRGIDGALTRLARCCAPVPGDEIAGFVTVGRGVSVHRRDCPNYLQQVGLQPQRRIETWWNTKCHAPIYHADLSIQTANLSGNLEQIMAIVNAVRVPTTALQAVAGKDRTVVRISLDVAGRAQLDDLVARIAALKDVIRVERAGGASPNNANERGA